MPDVTIAVTGDGRLSQAVWQRLADVAAPAGNCALLVVVDDGWETGHYQTARTFSTEHSVPWLPVRAELGRVVIGPLEPPGTTGCVTCADIRRRQIMTDPVGFERVWASHERDLAERPSSWLTGLGCDTVAAVLADEVSRYLDQLSQPNGQPDPPRIRGAVLVVDLATLDISRHPFLPDPLCPHCGSVPADRPTTLELQPRPKVSPDSYRLRSRKDDSPTLFATFVDQEAGVINDVATGHIGGLATARAVVATRSPGLEVAGLGRSKSYVASQLTAIFEALERYGGLLPGGRRTVVRGSYAELDSDALDPRTLGLYPAERYLLPDFLYRPFDVDVTCSWVWGYSLTQRRPVLVPETIAYYGAGYFGGEKPFVYECSNGCALGNCLEEAILHAVLEVAERDAFLLMWHARLPVPEIDLSTVPNPAVPLVATLISQETHWDVRAFDMTVEQGIPCVCVVGVNPADDAEQAKAACAGGSHLNPTLAIANALNELSTTIVGVGLRYAKDPDRARQLAADPSQVYDLADHSLMYANPAISDRFDFLLADERKVDMAKAFEAAPDWVASDDLRNDVAMTIERYRDTGLDVIVVDQTTPEHTLAGLACVKAIIPGTMPMTFGHEYRRLDGLPRLLNVPYQLGYRNRPLTHTEISIHPHPFP